MAEAGAAEVPGDLPFSERHRLAEPGWPKMAFIERSLEHDPTNWWAPNTAAVEAMLRSAGFRIIGSPGAETYMCEPDKEHPAAIDGISREEFIAATGRRIR
jgi:tRNA (mo5U34)-methyltransferase